MSQAKTLYDQAVALKDEQKNEEAIDLLKQAVELDPAYALAHLALAVCYGRVGKHDEAVAHGQKVCELEPSDPFSFTAMSVTYQRAYAGTGDQRFIPLAEDAMARAHSLNG